MKTQHIPEQDKKIFLKNHFNGIIILFLVFPLCLYGCLETDTNIITENPLTYSPPNVNSLSMPSLSSTSVTFNWISNKQSRGIVQISEDEDTVFEPEHTTTGRNVMTVPEYINEQFDTGHNLNIDFNLRSTIKKDTEQVYNSLEASTENKDYPYYTIENLTSPFPLAKKLNISSNILDIYYLHNIKYYGPEKKIFSEALFKHSLSTANVDKNKLSAQEINVFDSLTTWTLGSGTHTSPYISNHAFFDISFLINAGAVYKKELLFASFFSNKGDYGKNHQITIKGLIPEKEYFYRILSVDAWGKIWKTEKRSFKTTIPLRTYTSAVDSNGGKIETLTGLKLDLQPGDLVTKSNISICEYQNCQPLPEGYSIDGLMYYIGPDNLFKSAEAVFQKSNGTNSEIYKWNLDTGYIRLESQTQNSNNQITGKNINAGYYALLKTN